jgi:hypothetical protein
MFRFSIRELMLVTLVAGLVLGWWVDHWVAARRLAESTKRSERLKGVLLDAKAAVDVLMVPQEQSGSSVVFMPDFDSVLGHGAQRKEFKPQDRR